MEEKLLELIKVALAYNESSKKKYVAIHYEGYKNKIEIDIRAKNTHDFLSCLEVFDVTDDNCLLKVEDIIKAIKNLKID